MRYKNFSIALPVLMLVTSLARALYIYMARTDVILAVMLEHEHAVRGRVRYGLAQMFLQVVPWF